MKCGACKHWRKIVEPTPATGERGFCHRFPPVFFQGGFGFPVVNEDAGCGEYKPAQFSSGPADVATETLEIQR